MVESDLEVLDSHAAKLAKEDLDQLGAQGNRSWRIFWYCHGQASGADYQSSEERPLDVSLLHQFCEVSRFMDRCLKFKYATRAVVTPYRVMYKDAQKCAQHSKINPSQCLQSLCITQSHWQISARNNEHQKNTSTNLFMFINNSFMRLQLP